MRRLPYLTVLALGLVVLRGALGSLPGFGRDEATYLYWSVHFDLLYAPLLQAALAGLRALGASSPLAMRSLSLGLGILLLGLFDRWLVVRGQSVGSRRLAVAAVALSPWQTYVGSFVHPDNLLVAAMLAFALFANRDRFLGASAAALAAFWAKPSGLLVVGVAGMWLLWRASRDRELRPMMGLVLLTAGTALTIRQWSPEMIHTLRSYGVAPPGLSATARTGLAAGSLAFLAGPLPIVALFKGLRTWVRPPTVGECLGGVYALAFATAAVGLGQFKANWILPAILLMWPQLAMRRLVWRIFAVGAPALVSIAMTIAFVSPSTLERLERSVGSRAPSYLSLAGTREREVGSTRTWWQRTAEYQSIDAWTRGLAASQPALLGASVIVSDDYGLAAQFALSLSRIGPNPLPRLVMPFDPIFDHEPPVDGAATFVLAVRHSPEELWPRPLESMTWSHPVTGETIRLAWTTTPMERTPR